MSARFFHAGKKRPRPIWGLPGQFFAWAGKIQKMSKFCLFSLVGQCARWARMGSTNEGHGKEIVRAQNVSIMMLWPAFSRLRLANIPSTTPTRIFMDNF